MRHAKYSFLDDLTLHNGNWFGFFRNHDVVISIPRGIPRVTFISDDHSPFPEHLDILDTRGRTHMLYGLCRSLRPEIGKYDIVSTGDAISTVEVARLKVWQESGNRAFTHVAFVLRDRSNLFAKVLICPSKDDQKRSTIHISKNWRDVCYDRGSLLVLLRSFRDRVIMDGELGTPVCEIFDANVTPAVYLPNKA